MGTYFSQSPTNISTELTEHDHRITNKVNIHRTRETFLTQNTSQSVYSSLFCEYLNLLRRQKLVYLFRTICHWAFSLWSLFKTIRITSPRNQCLYFLRFDAFLIYNTYIVRFAAFMSREIDKSSATPKDQSC